MATATESVNFRTSVKTDLPFNVDPCQSHQILLTIAAVFGRGLFHESSRYPEVGDELRPCANGENFDLKQRVATLEGYVGVLRHLLMVHQQVISELQAVTWLGSALAPDRLELRVERLNVDLCILGDTSDTDQQTIKFALNDMGEALGAHYVLEGSALGAQIIASIVQKKLRVGAENGGAYFFGDGQQTSAHWSQFLGRLNQYEPSRFSTSAIAGAGKIFLAFGLIERPPNARLIQPLTHAEVIAPLR